MKTGLLVLTVAVAVVAASEERAKRSLGYGDRSGGYDRGYERGYVEHRREGHGNDYERGHKAVEKRTYVEKKHYKRK